MTTTLFGLDIANIVNEAITAAGRLQDVTLIKITPGTRTPGQLTGGTNPTPSLFSAQGYQDTLNVFRSDTVVKDASAAVGILGASIQGDQVPVAGDKVTIGSITYRILKVQADPVQGLYLCQVS